MVWMNGVWGAGIIHTFVMRNYSALCLALLVSAVDGRADGIAVERNCYGNMSGEEVGRLSLSVSVCVVAVVVFVWFWFWRPSLFCTL